MKDQKTPRLEQFEAVFAKANGDLVRFAKRNGIERATLTGATKYSDPEDFAQEQLIEYWEFAAKKSYTSFRAGTLWRIAQNRLIDAHRKNGSRPVLEMIGTADLQQSRTDDPPAPANGLSFEVLDVLSEKAADIFRLKHIAGYTTPAVAKLMGMSVEGVKSSLQRSKKRLQKNKIRCSYRDQTCHSIPYNGKSSLSRKHLIMNTTGFKTIFSKLTDGHTAHRWQSVLGTHHHCRNRLIRIPTGMGKTMGVG